MIDNVKILGAPVKVQVKNEKKLDTIIISAGPNAISTKKNGVNYTQRW